MKITIEKDNSVFAKKKPYIATFGAFSEKGNTKEEAKENLIQALEWFTVNSLYSQTIIKQLPAAQRTLILERSFNGYTVIVSYQDDEKGIKENTCHYGRLSHLEALKALENHVSNYTELV